MLRTREREVHCTFGSPKIRRPAPDSAAVVFLPDFYSFLYSYFAFFSSFFSNSKNDLGDPEDGNSRRSLAGAGISQTRLRRNRSRERVLCFVSANGHGR
ncbi:hypothetical protein LY76DRAFT_77077 [Colletotrichum caudatum]|nr:hypothetical protein LY76DRAFT_77077 [Colletotrichum caudatum]